MEARNQDDLESGRLQMLPACIIHEIMDIKYGGKSKVTEEFDSQLEGGGRSLGNEEDDLRVCK